MPDAGAAGRPGAPALGEAAPGEAAGPPAGRVPAGAVDTGMLEAGTLEAGALDGRAGVGRPPPNAGATGVPGALLIGVGGVGRRGGGVGGAVARSGGGEVGARVSFRLAGGIAANPPLGADGDAPRGGVAARGGGATGAAGCGGRDGGAIGVATAGVPTIGVGEAHDEVRVAAWGERPMADVAVAAPTGWGAAPTKSSSMTPDAPIAMTPPQTEQRALMPA